METYIRKKRQLLYVLIVILIVCFTSIITAGYLYYQNYKKRFQVEVEHQLSAIAELKVNELRTWRNERLANASVFYKNAYFSALVKRFFEKPDDKESQEQLRTWLSKLLGADNYDLITLLDTSYSKKMVVPNGQERTNSFISQNNSEILRSRKVAFEDFYWNEYNQRIYLKVLVPILDEANIDQIIGYLTLRISPEKYLYPFINNWPTPSQTAETLLVRREGNEVVFLNELRFKKNTALKLRYPLDKKKELPSVKAALGYEGIVKGIDYRGMPVLAYVCAIPDSPWFIVTRMDISEIYGPLKDKLQEIIIFITILLASAIAGGSLIWKQQNMHLYKQKAMAAEEWRSTFDSITDLVSIIDKDYKIKRVNKAFADVLGLHPKDVIGRTCYELVHGTKASHQDCPYKKSMLTKMAAKSEFFEASLNKYLEVCTSPVLDDKGEVISVVHITRDITERKQVAEKLQREKEFSNNIISTAQAIILILDTNGSIISFNPYMEQISGYRLEEVKGKDWFETFLPKEDSARIRETFKKSKSNIHTKGNINPIIAKDGHKIEIEWYDNTIKAADDSVAGVLAIGLDITERKKAEESLIISEEKFRAIFNNSTDGIIITDTETKRFHDANKNMCQMLGYSLEELKKMGVTDIYPKEHLPYIMEQIEKQSKDSIIPPADLPIKRKDGSIFYASVLGTKMTLVEKEYIVAIFRDITERKKAERNIEYSHRLLQRIIDLLPIRVFWKDENLRYLGCNQIFAKDAGASKPDDLIGKDDYQMVWKEQAELYRNDDQSVIDSGKARINFEEPQTTPEGNQIWLKTSKLPLTDFEGNSIGVLGTYEDITERKQIEHQLEVEKENAEAANKAKSMFLANMSHEIRTPMNAIMGFCQILSDEKMTSEQANYINIIHNSSKHLLQVINDILDFSKIEAGKMDIKMAECNLKHLFSTIESMMKPVVTEKGLEFMIRLSDDLPLNIYTDPARLQQCLINLVNNAVKFTDKGHVYVNVSLEDRNNQKYICFDVEDTGIGISAEEQKKLFKSFSQIDESHSRKHGGTGLGLAITKQLSELLNGMITLSSKEGMGSTFSLMIPAGLDVTKQPLLDRYDITNRDCISEEEQQQSKFSGHVLVADDVKTNQLLVKSMLNRLGLEVTIAADGYEVTQKAINGNFDLIFMDIQMPNMDGYEATKILRNEGIKTPIIALTANAIKGDDLKCIDSGCDDYLSKPLDNWKLQEKILKYLLPKKQALVEKVDSLKSQADDL